MTEEIEQKDLAERVELIEQMIAEGRRTTGRWGWVFVLWGVAYLVATGWASFGHSNAAWPVTMTVASILTVILRMRMRRGAPTSGLSRAVGALWLAAGISLALVLFGLAYSGHYEPHAFLAVVGGILGLTNFASSVILRWRSQLFCAFVWWIEALAACFLSEQNAGWVFLTATFLGQIVFGIYVMIAERHRGAEVVRHA